MNESMSEDQKRLARIRANLYGRLQFLYTYPIPKRKVEPLLQLWVKEQGKTTSEGYPSPLAKIVNAINDWDSFVRDLNAEYKRLFFGSESPLVPLSASLYLGEKEVAKLGEIYSGWKMFPLRLVKASIDSIALEFAFLGNLATQDYRTLVENDQARHVELLQIAQEFLREHVKTWVPSFCQRTQSTTQNEFFKWLSATTLDIIETDFRVTGKLLRESAPLQR
jgi:TorA maturation chaperone TorD